MESGERKNKKKSTKRALFVFIDLSNSKLYDDYGDRLIVSPGNSSSEKDRIDLLIDFHQISKYDEKGNYAGVCFSDFDVNNWYMFYKKNAKLVFNYNLEDEDFLEYQIEVDTKSKGNKKISKKYKIEDKSGKIELLLKTISRDKNLWRNIGEVCLVFFPKSSNYKGLMTISDMKIIKQ